ncbi:hypothetical protein Ppa06_70600 [Planomonospora parontospora subsp. parontospora]|uniref:Serine protease n=2 Tax=Planomonospora parontospora TaxID=58119 RepID=A0AA37BP52_9ACTN|nr:hypothetical protein [Planomonospora parontospora]GGL01656.1 hypothetical protein GCM10010126_71120 [Planomonospora parontospora]GII13262.1 hypothetical protein Ppa06_70600 [Planomonospora parontospora subsp. parontospora]
MKRILLPAGGAILATGLLAAGLAGTAQADPTWAYDTMAKDAPTAIETAKFWLAANGKTNRLAEATPYTWETKATPKLSVGGGYTPDGKPGSVVPIGEEKKSATVVKNINLPKTIGKVFFVDSDNNLKWCSATSIQAKYRNLVATAGHCVYDDAKNSSVMDHWIFVPGYYQGKAPWGVYVGKTAYTHYDYSAFEDRDRDYAFVTVYNGVQVGGGSVKEISKSEFDKAGPGKFVKETPITAEQYAAGYEKYGEAGPYKAKAVDPKVEHVAKPAGVTNQNFHQYVAGKDGVKVVGVEVLESQFNAAAQGLDNGNRYNGLSQEVAISKEEFDALTAAKADGKFLGKLTAVKVGENVVGWKKQQFFVKAWVKTTAQTKYWVETYYLAADFIKDTGRLGDNVGGQGFAWNQKTGQKVFVFGYPADAHPDGHKAYTGVTAKWCYGTTTGKTYTHAATKVEEHVGLKCAMTPGADGSPWLIKYSNAKRLGYVNGVTSLFGDQDKNNRYDLSTSAYFDGETAAIYNKAAAVWSGSIVK